MILDIALGIVLGFVILANLRGLVALGAFIAVSLLLLLALGTACWLLYAAFDATRSFLPLLRLSGTAAAVADLVGGVLANVLLAFVCGQVLQQRSKLSPREANVFGALFYVMFLFSILAIPVAIEAYSQARTVSAPLFLLVLVGAWTLIVRQCVLRSKMRRRTIAA
jgi:hypothetical protein